MSLMCCFTSGNNASSGGMIRFFLEQLNLVIAQKDKLLLMDANLVYGLKGIAVANDGIRVVQSITEVNQVLQPPSLSASSVPIADHLGSVLAQFCDFMTLGFKLISGQVNQGA